MSLSYHGRTQPIQLLGAVRGSEGHPADDDDDLASARKKGTFYHDYRVGGGAAGGGGWGAGVFPW